MSIVHGRPKKAIQVGRESKRADNLIESSNGWKRMDEARGGKTVLKLNIGKSFLKIKD